MSEEMQEIMKRLKLKQVTLSDVFYIIDIDKSGKLSKYEFLIFTKRIGMNLTDHRINEIFANVKKVSDGEI